MIINLNQSIGLYLCPCFFIVEFDAAGTCV